jgi:hypothetical protein
MEPVSVSRALNPGCSPVDAERSTSAVVIDRMGLSIRHTQLACLKQAGDFDCNHPMRARCAYFYYAALPS